MRVRIIAGHLRSRQLLVPQGERVRPTSDRVKEALFSLLGGDLTGRRVLDLFAGSGALGFEALSRGAVHATFVDRDREALTALRSNVQALGVGAQCRVLPFSVLRALQFLEGEAGTCPPFDLVFADPPYADGLLWPTLTRLAGSRCVAPGALIVAEGDRHHEAATPPPGLQPLTRRAFGETVVHVFRLGDARSPDAGGAAAAIPQEKPMERLAVYPGSFDPITNGHVDIVRRGLRVFDRIIVAVANNAGKRPLFSLDERLRLAERSFADETRVEVASFSGLLVDFLRRVGAHVMVRGLRAVSDFEYEFQMACMNRRLLPDVETFFMIPGENYFYLSSSIVREVAELHGSIADLVPPPVLEALEARFGKAQTP